MNMGLTQLLHVADAVAREKGIQREEVLEAMEQAIQKAGRTKYGQEYDIRAQIDRGSGQVQLFRFREIVAEVENEMTEITLADAQKINAAFEVGDFIKDQLPPIDFGRVAAQTARQVIFQKVREAERQTQYDEFKDRVHEVINGVVKRIEFGNVIIDLGRAEGLLRRDDLIPRENLRVGDRTRAIISEVNPELKGHQILLSRAHNLFMKALFTQEVPEIYDGVIEIKAVARDPGSRAKIAVHSKDASLDPVGSCVGVRGSRVQAVVGELQGEKVDIIVWSENPAIFVVNALAPAEIIRVVLEEEDGRLEVIVPDDQLSLAIGRRGQNVRLASQLTGYTIDVTSESDDMKKRAEVSKKRTDLFKDALDVDEMIAQLLVTEGFSSVEEVAEVVIEDLTTIEGFDEEIAQELQNRAQLYLREKDNAMVAEYQALGVEKELAAVEGLSSEMLLALAKKDVKTLDDFADLATDELLEHLSAFDLDEEKASQMILAARAHWFEEEGA